MIPRNECTGCEGRGEVFFPLALYTETTTCEFCKGTGLVPPPGLEPGPRERADFESAASTNSAKGATAEGVYHGLSYPRKEEGNDIGRAPGEAGRAMAHHYQGAPFNMRNMKPKQYRIDGRMMPLREMNWPTIDRKLEFLTVVRRLRLLMADITLTNGWEVSAYYDDRGYFYLQVGAEDGTCNVTGKPVRWSGRKWLLSEHMTDGEIIQTALKAVLAAHEHEAREQFLFKGQAIFDPHYDLVKLVRLRSAEDALSERAEGATVSSHDDVAKDPSGAGDGDNRGGGTSGPVRGGEAPSRLTNDGPDWGFC